MSYRKDIRSDEEFAEDIQKHTKRELDLFIRWLDFIKNKTGKVLTYQSIGCGPDGEVLADKDVSVGADFEVEEYGKIDVKFSNVKIKDFFHLKEKHVLRYIEDDVSILMVNDAEGTPVFTLLDPRILANVKRTCQIVNFGGFGFKPSFRIPIGDFIWRQLD